MPEVYICLCGGQSWGIDGLHVECLHCNREYPISYPATHGERPTSVEMPNEFNARIIEEEKKKK